jgi:Flp pilus assembly protein TadG
MMRLRRLRRDNSGAAVIEMAFALPAMIIMMWAIVQLGLVFRAMSGIQHALGEGARFATLFPQPENDAIKAKIQAAVYGIGPGTFTISDPVADVEDGSVNLMLTVSYTQSTDLLLLPGPDITVSRSKKVWVAGIDEDAET